MKTGAIRSSRVLVALSALAVTGATILGGCAAPSTSASSATSASADAQSAQSATAQSAASSAASTSSSELYTIDDELRVRINRAELENLKLEDGPIYVTGHKSPDTDTVCSAIAYADLLKQLGYDAKPVVLGDVNKETAYVLKEAGVSVPERLEDASGANMVLVDHSEYEQSAEGLKDANVISIIDHHGDGTVFTANPILYDSRPIGATATIMWMRYVNYGIKPDPTICKLLLGAILSDTSNLKSELTTTADREALTILAAEAGVADVNAFYAGMYKESISYEGQTDEQIYNSDIKTYETGGHRYAIGVVQVYDEDEAKAMAERMKAVMPSQLKALDVEYAFAQISIYHDDISINYLVPADEASNAILKAAYGDTTTFDGTSYVAKPGFSRKGKFVPDIDAVLNASPKE